MKRLFGVGILIAACATTGCLMPQRAIMYERGYLPCAPVVSECDPCGAPPIMMNGCEPCGVPMMNECDPCGAPMMPYYGTYGACSPTFDGSILRYSAEKIENCVNTTGNVVAGVVMFPFRLVGGLTRCFSTAPTIYPRPYSGEVYCGDYAYQPQDFCDPCRNQSTVYQGNYSGNYSVGYSVGAPCNCGAETTTISEMGIPTLAPPAPDAGVSVRRPSRIIPASAVVSRTSPTRNVTTASFQMPRVTR